MKIGILSETHGHVDRTKSAINVLLSENIDVVIHCGDLGSETVIFELLTGFQPHHTPVYAVLGNVDFPDDLFSAWSKSGEFEILGRFGELTIEKKHIAIIHGDNFQQLRSVTIGCDYDYIFTGHTHVKEDRREGKTRIINPGAVYRAAVPTVAVLDLSNDHLEFVEIS